MDIASLVPGADNRELGEEDGEGGNRTEGIAEADTKWQASSRTRSEELERA